MRRRQKQIDAFQWAAWFHFMETTSQILKDAISSSPSRSIRTRLRRLRKELKEIEAAAEGEMEGAGEVSDESQGW